MNSIKLDENLITPDELIKILNLKNKRALYNLINRKKLPFLKIGGRLRFKLSDIEKWIIEQNNIQKIDEYQLKLFKK